MLELEKLDWEKLEHKLASSYDQLNWGRINENLNSAVKEIKLDSLIEVYTIADQQLENLEREVEAKTDSQVHVSVSADISLEQIKQNKQVIKLNLEKAKAVRNKKIIHL